MGIYKAEFHYFCLPAHHENRITRYYRASDIEDLKRRFSFHYPCAQCSPSVVLTGTLEVEWEVEEISEINFEESGATLEPDIM